jgi:hypothetical protein
MGFRYPSYHFASGSRYTGAEGWRNSHLFSSESGVHVALTREWFCLPEMDDLWNAFTLNGRISSWARGPRLWLINDWNIPFRLPRR